MAYFTVKCRGTQREGVGEVAKDHKPKAVDVLTKAQQISHMAVAR